MIHSTDQLNRSLNFESVPRRIVSVVPSQTELLSFLSLEREVLGITKFCVHPSHWRSEKSIVGGTKNLDLDKIKKISPDLIIANKEENESEQILTLSEEFPVWVSDVQNLEDALSMIREIGKITDKSEKSGALIQDIRIRFNSLENHVERKKASVLYLIWKNPYISVGIDTFINDMLEHCGFNNLMNSKQRYPELSFDEIMELSPECIFLSTEPYPFSIQDVNEFSILFPKSKIYLVDGEMFSWYGSRLAKSVDYFRSLVDEVNFAS